MATGGLYGQSGTGALIATPGAESVGLYGNTTSFGGTYFEWFIFQVADTQPATPTGGSWSFTTNSGTPPTGWLATPPVNPTNTVWVSIGLVNSKSTSAIVWSTPGKFSFASGLPILSGSSAPLSSDGQTDQLYIETGTTPETIWFKQVGTWTRLTGSSLYVDLTSNQTISGTKTFASQIQGSISGNATNVTGIVDINHGGTGQTTANAGFNALAPTQTGNSGKFLTTDGTNASWSTNPLGTVTSVNASGGTTGLTFSGGPVTTSGTLTLAGTLAVANGGTGVTTSTGSGNTVLSTAPTLNNPTISNYEAFTPSSAPTYAEGLMWYDSSSYALAYYNNTTNNTLHIGQEIQQQVRNSTGSTITKGSVVYISGSTGQIGNVILAQANAYVSSQVIGIANQDIANNTNGWIVTQGTVTNINTSAFTAGNPIYLSATTAGALTQTEPSTPNYAVHMGVCLYSNTNNGKIYINPINKSIDTGYIIGQVAIAQGGTGQTTANAAFNALAPTQTGNSGKYLTTDGTNTSWATNPLGTVTSVGGTGTVSGITLSGTVTTSGNLTLGGALDLSAYNGAGAFTTLSASSTVTFSGGTANGVAYLNGSKVLTTGSALTFDGTTLVAPYGGLQLGTLAYFTGGGTSNLIAGTNAAYGLELRTNSTTRYQIDSAGTSIWTIGSEQMRLTSTGLGIGTSSPAYKLDVQSQNVRLNSGAANAYALFRLGGIAADSLWGYAANANEIVTGASAGDTVFGSNKVGSNLRLISGNGVLNATLDSSGNLGLGVTPSAWVSIFKAFQVGAKSSLAYYNGNTYLSSNFYNDGVAAKYITTDYATQYNQTSGQHQWYTAPSGTAGNAISFTQAMTLDASGNLGVGTTSPVAKLDVLGGNARVALSAGSAATFRGYEFASATTVFASVKAESSGGELRIESGFSGFGGFSTFYTNGAERARIDSSGNFIQSAPTTPPSLSTNGTMVFNLTSNSNLRVSVRGSDGVTRVANIVLV